MRKVDLKHHELWIHVPTVEEPKDGFPVLYVLDGNAYSSIIFEIMKLQINNSKRTKVKPIIIVGISYKGEGPFFTKERTRDFTPLATNNNTHPRGANLSEYSGGIENFSEELLEIKNYMNTNYHIDNQHVGIFGHSLGGLFVCESLYMKSIDFTHYIAVSPSLWWNEHSILRKEINFENKSLLVCVEGETSMKKPAKEYIQHCKSVSVLNEDSKCTVYEEENHMSVVTACLGEVLRFISN